MMSNQEPSAQSELSGLVVNGKACKYFQPEYRESSKVDKLRDEFYAKYKKILPAKEAPISEENSIFGYSPADKDLSAIGPS